MTPQQEKDLWEMIGEIAKAFIGTNKILDMLTDRVNHLEVQTELIKGCLEKLSKGIQS